MQQIMNRQEGFVARSFQIRLVTTECTEFIDITDSVALMLRESGIQNGLVNVQTCHTTTSILINENEPQLLQDMQDVLQRLIPKRAQYRHDDFTIRTINVGPDETPNGHAHCKAFLMRTSETINIVDGELDLGRWQRIFFIELDRPKPRTISVMILGQ
jgi:secondary thiamine-phosphate synthase enzyme